MVTGILSNANRPEGASLASSAELATAAAEPAPKVAAPAARPQAQPPAQPKKPDLEVLDHKVEQGDFGVAYYKITSLTGW